MSAFAIRTATLDDVEELCGVFRRSSLSNDGDRAGLLAAPEHLSFDGAHVAQDRTRVVAVDEQIVGFATTLDRGETLELEDLFVDPDWMRQGVGRLLVADALALGEASGSVGIEVTANPHALDFYESVGFVGEAQIETALGAGRRMRLTVLTR